MKKAIIYLFLLLTALTPYDSSALEYSLDDLFRISLERSEALKISEDDIFISLKEEDRAKSVLFPTLSAFGTHTRYSKDKYLGETLLQPERTNEWGVRLDQSFSLSGREITAFDIAKKGKNKTMMEFHATRETYLLNVATAYYNVLKAKKTVEMAAANVERLSKHRNAAKTRLKVGEATRTSLLRAEAELSAARSELVMAENTHRIVRSVLAKTAGISGSFELTEPEHGAGFTKTDRESKDIEPLTGECEAAPLDCLVEKAMSERAEIRSAVIQKEISRETVKYTKGSYWPDLSLEGVYYRQSSEPERLSVDESVYGALTLNFPFFEGGLRKAEVGQSRARLRQAEHSLSELKKAIKLDVENSYLNLLTVSAVIDHLRAEVEYARDNFNAVTKQFRHGLADSIDVIDANTLLATSERELANAEYEYMLAVLKLKREVGTLLESVIASK